MTRSPARPTRENYERDHSRIASSTMCGWHEQLAELCFALMLAMRNNALRQPYLCTDATGVLVVHPERCKRGHFWVLVTPGLHLLFAYTESHDKTAVAAHHAGPTRTVPLHSR